MSQTSQAQEQNSFFRKRNTPSGNLLSNFSFHSIVGRECENPKDTNRFGTKILIQMRKTKIYSHVKMAYINDDKISANSTCVFMLFTLISNGMINQLTICICDHLNIEMQSVFINPYQ